MTYLDHFSLPMESSTVIVLALVVGLAGVGVAAVYFVGDPQSPATRALAVAVGLVGIANAAYPAQHVLHPDGRDAWWLVQLPLLDALVMCGLLLWMLRVARTSQASDRAHRWIRTLVVLFGLVTAVYLILGALYPIQRMTRFLFCLGTEVGCGSSSFWMFAVPVSLMGSLLVFVGALVFSQNIDVAERVRVISVAIATPFFFANYVLPVGYNVMTSLPGLFVFLIGGVRYQTIQGERGQFLSRFLSPAVVREVAVKGLATALEPRKVEITVVCCDLRGFTRFSVDNDSDAVMRLMGEYYETVGAVVARYEATIKDYSGDGVMVLVGAPISVPDHAERGLRIAEETASAVGELLSRWSQPSAPLAVGLGVATGIVAVGAIGSSSRMDYTAIGSAPNLASRLCGQAAGGEILVAARSAELAGMSTLEARDAVALKGIGDVPHFASRRADAIRHEMMG